MVQRFQFEVVNGTPVLRNEICLKLIDEIERFKGASVKTLKTEREDDDSELQSLWPQLRKVLSWLVRNEFDKAVELSKLIVCRRKHELEKEKARIEEEKNRESYQR